MTFDQEIRRAIESSARVLLIVDVGGLTSEYVAQEWGFADDVGVPVVPVLRQGTLDQLPGRLQSYQAIDGRPPKAMEVIVGDVVRFLSEPVLPLGTSHGVPLPPPHELARSDLLERLSLVLGLDRQRPEEAGRTAQRGAIWNVRRRQEHCRRSLRPHRPCFRARRMKRGQVRHEPRCRGASCTRSRRQQMAH
jgi:hypothetical protein